MWTELNNTNGTVRVEADPNGMSPHDKGSKLDAGKLRAALVLGGFARALLAVSEVGTFGAAKYTPNGWMEVPNGEERYDDAKMRHWLQEKTGEPIDKDSQLLHAKHEAWNALARLDLMLRRLEQQESLPRDWGKEFWEASVKAGRA